MIALLLAVALAAPEPKREHFQRVEVIYGRVGRGLRTFVTKPREARGRVPVIFFVGWLSCDSMEYPGGDTDGFGAFMRRLIDQPGFATLRMDKPGVGESEGDCARADLDAELAGWRAAFDSLSTYDFVDTSKIFVVGISNGGGFSPLAVRGKPVLGYVAVGSWGRTWYEHMLEQERGNLERAKKSPAEVNSGVKALASFYDLYLVQGLTPGAVLARHPEWKQYWSDASDGQYGRPAAFYQQLQALNLGAVWQDISAPVLSVRGGDDVIMTRADAETLARIARNGRYVEVPGMTHLLTVAGKFHEPAAAMVNAFLREQLR